MKIDGDDVVPCTFSPDTPARAGTMFKCTAFSSVTDNEPTEVEYSSFPEFAGRALTAGHERRPAKDGELFSPVTYRPGATRKKANVDLVYAVGLDVEHLTPERAKQLFETLEPLERLIYTTYSHRPEDPRYRVILPLVRPVPAMLYDQLWKSVSEFVGKDVIDPAAKDASRMFYTPSAPPNAEGHWIEYHVADGQSVFTLDPVDCVGDSPAALAQLEKAADDVVNGSAAASAPPVATTNVIALPRKLAAKPRPTRAELERRLRAIGRVDTREPVEKLLAGEPFAEQGSRDAMLYSLASTVAWIAPEAEVDDLLPLFEKSLAAMAAANTDPANPAPTMAHAREKLHRALAQRRERYVAETRLFPSNSVPAAVDSGDVPSVNDLGSVKLIEGSARGSGPGERVHAYTRAELERFAREQGCETVEEFGATRLIIQRGTSYYVYGGQHGRYLPPVGESEVMRTIERDMAPLIRANVVDLWAEKTNKDGSTSRRPKKLDELIQQHGRVARDCVIQMGLEAPRYDAESHTMIESACTVRSDLTPKYTPEIDCWLRLLGGSLAEKLLDWLATFLILMDPTCALMLQGASGAGKTMLAEGLAKLFGRYAQPVPFADFVGSWNSAILSVPLVFADEHMPGNGRRSSDLRAIVARSTHKVKRKFLPDADLRGCIRVMLAANNSDLLGLADEDATEDDVAAVAARVLDIRVGPAAAEYLERIGGRSATEAWVRGDLIARHVLHLAQTRTVERGRRFLVTGDASQLALGLMTRSPTASGILEWIGHCTLDRGHALTLAAPGLARVGGGQVLISLEALRSHWEMYCKGSWQPETEKLGTTLKRLATSRTPTRPGPAGGKRPRLFQMNLELLFHWAEHTGFAERDQLMSAVSGSTKTGTDT